MKSFDIDCNTIIGYKDSIVKGKYTLTSDFLKVMGFVKKEFDCGDDLKEARLINDEYCEHCPYEKLCRYFIKIGV